MRSSSDQTVAEAAVFAVEDWQRCISLLQEQLAERDRELQLLRSREASLAGRALYDRLINSTRRVSPWGTLRGQITGYALSTVAVAALEAGRALAGRADSSPSQRHAGPPVGRDSSRQSSDWCRMDRTAPFISVIVPVYNAERCDARYLNDALESVAAQTYRHFELIVVDDGSTDGSAAAVESFMASHRDLNTRLVRKRNGGQSGARNKGADCARGEWLAFLDQDDIWLPERLEIVLPCLDEAADLVYTDADTIDEQGQVQERRIHGRCGAGGRHPKTRLSECLFEDCFVMPGITTVRREFFLRIGGFDERLSGYEDDDLFVRAVQTGRIAYLPVSTLRWRFYSGNYSNTHRMVQSRLRYWRKLIGQHGDNGADLENTRRLTLRFLRQFLAQCSQQLRDGDPLAAENLRAAQYLLPFLGPIDRLAFGAVSWAFGRHSRSAARARQWFLIGLESSTPQG